MRRSLIGLAAVGVAAFAFPAAAGAAPALHTTAGSDNVGFGFNARNISGISGAVTHDRQRSV